MANNVLSIEHEIGQYDSCWFEILTNGKRIVTRDHNEFLRKSGALSRVQEITLYKIERTVSGFRKSRIHVAI